MRFTVVATIAALAIATPAFAHRHDRDHDRHGHDAHEEGNGFHRYYGSQYGVTDRASPPEGRDGGDWRDGPRDHQRRGRTPNI